MSAEHLLVVGYSPQVRKLTRRALKSHGYSVSEARTGEEALEKLQEEEYDLVLLDLHTPGIGGIEATRAIRSHSDSAMIVFTVRDTDRDRAEALNVGADDYLAKPFSTGELLTRLRAVLRRGSARVNAVPEHLSLRAWKSTSCAER